MKNPLVLSSLMMVLSAGSLVAQNFDQKSILSDLEFLRNSLEQAHYNLYAYTDREAFTKNYLEVKNSITQDSLSLLQATSIFQQVVSKANTGHAEIDFPIAAYQNYAMSGGTVFPLELSIEEDRVFIRKNFSNATELTPGDELLAIDGVDIHAIIDTLHRQLSAETPYFKNAKLEYWSFPRLFWQVYGQKDAFTVSVKRDEKLIHVTTPAVELINGYELKRNEIITPDRYLKFDGTLAYLKPGNFSGDEAEYEAFIDSAFAEIRAKNMHTLIVDLRNNAGGHNEFSNYLVSHFASKPFKWNSKFTVKTSAILKAQTRLNNDTTDLYFKEILARENGTSYEYRCEDYSPQDQSRRFTGHTYVLINRHSYSMAAVTAAMIQDHHFGTLVGELTGDFPTLYASQFQYNLPNTGVAVKVPKGYIIRPNQTELREGVTPDIFIKDHLVDEKDEILNQLLRRIKESYAPQPHQQQRYSR